MATTYKNLGTNDIVSTRTLLHEAIPITGTIVSGTYSDNNIKNYSHGMFQSVYDYPYLSSSANHIFDITVGYSSQSSLSSSTNSQNSKKINIYNQMAQILMGYDQNGSIRRFQDGGVNSGSFMNECVFLPFTRLLSKDEIKKGSFTLELGLSGTYTSQPSGDGFGRRATLKDTNAQNDYRINSPAGEYGILYITGSTAISPLDSDVNSSTAQPAGLLFYQAGICVMTGAVFQSASFLAENVEMNSLLEDFDAVLTGSEISSSADALRHRFYNLSFNNTTELNSTIYFCRANAADFNYSANPTYLSSSKLVVKNESTDEPVSYITTVGLYSADNELLATAKLSEPLKKTPSTEFTIRTRLDY